MLLRHLAWWHIAGGDRKLIWMFLRSMEGASAPYFNSMGKMLVTTGFYHSTLSNYILEINYLLHRPYRIALESSKSQNFIDLFNCWKPRAFNHASRLDRVRINWFIILLNNTFYSSITGHTILIEPNLRVYNSWKLENDWETVVEDYLEQILLFKIDIGP